jgi:hypothetical protein
LQHVQEIPEGYSSVFVYKPGEGKQSSAHSKFSYQYYVPDPALQVLPLYLVTHFSEPGNSRHREVDDQEVWDRYEFFDPVLHAPVSFRDKMTGSHSAGKLATHQLVSMKTAYKSAIEVSKCKDDLMESHQNAILDDLKDVAKRLKEVHQNSSDMKKKICKLFEGAMNSLQAETEKKMNLLMNDELDLRRQLEHMKWSEECLASQRGNLPPADFLSAWNEHLQMRTDVSNWRSSHGLQKAVDDVYPDLQVFGEVFVCSQDKMASNDQYKNQSPVRGGTPASPYHQQQSRNPDSNTAHRSSQKTTASIKQNALLKRISQYSLEDQAERKMRLLSIDASRISAFVEGRLLTPTQAISLYMCIPFTRKIPETRLVFATWNCSPEDRNIGGVLRACEGAYAKIDALSSPHFSYFVSITLTSFFCALLWWRPWKKP